MRVRARTDMAAFSVALVLGSLCASVQGQEKPLAIRGATILTGTGDVIERGTLVLRGGKIVALGEALSPPESADVIEADGLFATPGFIDAYSHVGLREAGPSRDFALRDARWNDAERSLPAERESLMLPSHRVIDGLETPRDSPWLRSGVTTTYVSPGGQHLVGGFGTIIKLTGRIVLETAAMSVSFGESALNAFEAPTTRQGMVAILRQTLVRAQEDALEGEEGRVLARVLAGELPVHVLANTPDDVLTALRLAREFGLNLVLESAAGGHEVAGAIADAKVPVVVGPAIIGTADGGPFETFAHTPANAAVLHRAGVRIALSTAGAGRGRSVAMEVAVAEAHGLPEGAALRAVTADAAAVLGVGDRLGTLAAGMDADIVLWAGHPIGTWGETQRVIVDGETVFQR